MSKKRRLSPSASSRSSSTPVPSFLAVPVDTPGSPLASDGGVIAVKNAGVGSTAPSFADRKEARLGAVVPGSGDGSGQGEECFLWADLPMNKQGEAFCLFNYQGSLLTYRISISTMYFFTYTIACQTLAFLQNNTLPTFLSTGTPLMVG